MDKRIASRADNFSAWYNDIIAQAKMAEHSSVRGSMIIKPYGYAIWEKMQSILDGMLKKTGHQNAYFPLFIPKSFLSKEAAHIEGFAKECAVITHYRLKNNASGAIVVDPEAKLDEELIVRPTSETMIWHTFKKWIQSYRDLPILLNQWANVVRWEMRPRLFLRTSEFLWQEGHTAHANKEEALKETEDILALYTNFVEQTLCIPVIRGIKSESEKFAGAQETYCIEALTQDGKALQAGTSHFLGQNFAKAFGVKYLDKQGKEQFVWSSSWGVSTRLIGGLIMVHGDDNGLVLPPKIAPVQVIFIPIGKSSIYPQIAQALKAIFQELDKAHISYEYDDDESKRPGYKFAQQEMRGIPLRMVIGQRDLENQNIEIVRRDKKEKMIVPIASLTSLIPKLLDEIQENLLEKARQNLQKNIRLADNYDTFKSLIADKGGFVSAHWDGSRESEEKIKKETLATIRCIPLDNPQEKGKCIYSGKPSSQRVLFAKAY